jgi:CubicO group peptidase (beta-lactamase class C family)
MVSTAAISELLRRATDTGDVPGVVAAAATREGDIFSGAFGVRSLATGAPMTTDTVVRIASMTKAVTGACAMQLVEQGRLPLDEPLGSLLPELGRAQVLDGFDAGGAPRLRPAKRAPTLRELLTHTSGHVYDTWNDESGRYRAHAGLPTLDSGLNAALETPLAFDPGTRWEYGTGIDWAGKAVEAVSGMKLGRYMQANLFDPLGMADTGFVPGEAQRARQATIHVRAAEGLTPFERTYPANPEYEAGGGGLASTVPDYLKFAKAILHGGAFNGARILKPETVALMGRNAMGDLDTRRMTTAMPLRSNDVDFVAGMKWGLSFLINPAAWPGRRSAHSLAWAGLMNSYYWIDREKGVTGVFATQILPFCDVKALPLFEQFEREVYKAL